MGIFIWVAMHISQLNNDKHVKKTIKKLSVLLQSILLKKLWPVKILKVVNIGKRKKV